MDSRPAISTLVGTFCRPIEGTSNETHVLKTGHTWSHADLTTLNETEIDVEILRLDEAFVKILGVKPKLFRCALNMRSLVDSLLTSLL